jgi:hypothetical protein
LSRFLRSPRSPRPALRSSDNQGRHGMNSRPMLQEHALFRRSCEHPCLNAMAFTLQSALPVRPFARRIPAHTDSSFRSHFSRISRQGFLFRWHPHRTFGLLPTVLLWILFLEGTRPPPSLRLCTAANAFRILPGTPLRRLCPCLARRQPLVYRHFLPIATGSTPHCSPFLCLLLSVSFLRRASGTDFPRHALRLFRQSIEAQFAPDTVSCRSLSSQVR